MELTSDDPGLGKLRGGVELSLEPMDGADDSDGIVGHGDSQGEVGVMEWQPIDTAPEYSGAVLGYGLTTGEINGSREAPVIAVIRPQGAGWVVAEGDYYTVWMEPTHWMPLPEPPA